MQGPVRSARVVALCAWLGAAAAWAQAPVGELASLRARYGVSLRSGAQSDAGPGLTYSGVTANDLALSGAFWPGAGHFGLGGFVHREGFMLFDGAGQPLTGGSLMRAHLAPSARVALGPLTFEGLAGYAFAQLPSFGANSVQPRFGAALRHGPLLGARAQVELPFALRLEARGEYPLALFAEDASGAAATASGFSAGAALSWRGGRFGRLAWAVVADYQYAQDRLEAGGVLAATQTLSRAGLGLELAWLDGPPPAPPPRAAVERAPEVPREEPAKVGGLELRLVDEADARPISQAVVRISDRTFTSNASGQVTVVDLPPGPVALRVEAEGYRPVDEVAQVVLFQTAQVPLALVRAKRTLPATVNGVVRSTRGGAPVMATLELPEAGLITTATGRGTFSLQVPGGTYTVRISAPGFTAQSKKVTVREGDVAIFNVDLHPAR